MECNLVSSIRLCLAHIGVNNLICKITLCKLLCQAKKPVAARPSAKDSMRRRITCRDCGGSNQRTGHGRVRSGTTCWRPSPKSSSSAAAWRRCCS